MRTNWTRNLIFIFILLSLGAFVQRIFFSEKIAERLENNVPILSVNKPTPMKNPAQRINTEFVKISPIPANNTGVDERYTKVPKDHIVDFKVVNGLAVAFGDTVMGKLPENVKETSGLTETHPVHLWKSNEIPYAIDDTIKNKTSINQAIDLFQTRTNLKFVPYTDQEDAVIFTTGTENCMSSLGRIGGLQPIYLEPKCGKIEIAHELMHALGFAHEQSRIDRDQYITIFWDNIQAQFQSQFEMIPESLMDVYGDTPFDPTSIMMYSPHIFSTNPNVETMKLKNDGEIENAPQGLSDIDVMRVNRLYRN